MFDPYDCTLITYLSHVQFDTDLAIGIKDDPLVRHSELVGSTLVLGSGRAAVLNRCSQPESMRCSPFLLMKKR